MDLTEIQKAMAALKASLGEQPSVPEPTVAKTETTPTKKKATKKEVLPTPEQVISAAGPPPFEVIAQPEAQVESPGPCFTNEFKKLILHITPAYLGNKEGQAMLTEVLGSFPTCPG